MRVISIPGKTYLTDSTVQFNQAGYDKRIIEVHKLVEGEGVRYAGMIYREYDAQQGKVIYSAFDHEAGDLFAQGATDRTLPQAKRLFREKYEDERDKQHEVELRDIRARKKSSKRDITR